MSKANKITILTDIFTPMFTAELFTIAKKMETNCIHGWMEFSSAIKRREGCPLQQHGWTLRALY